MKNSIFTLKIGLLFAGVALLFFSTGCPNPDTGELEIPCIHDSSPFITCTNATGVSMCPDQDDVYPTPSEPDTVGVYYVLRESPLNPLTNWDVTWTVTNVGGSGPFLGWTPIGTSDRMILVGYPTGSATPGPYQVRIRAEVNDNGLFCDDQATELIVTVHPSSI